MPFSGFLKPKPDGGRKPTVGKQIITPSSANSPINFGFHDGTGYSAAVVVPVANVLTGTTIAGQAGTMPSNVGSYVELPWSTNTYAPRILPKVGYYDGDTYNYIIDTNLSAANILSGKSIFGVAGTVKQAPVITAGDIAIDANGSSTISTSSPDWVPIKETKINALNLGSGIARIKFGLRTDNGTFYAYGQVWKNGVPVGVEHSNSTTTTVWFTDDISIADGDLIQVYAHTDIATHSARVVEPLSIEIGVSTMGSFTHNK